MRIHHSHAKISAGFQNKPVRPNRIRLPPIRNHASLPSLPPEAFGWPQVLGALASISVGVAVYVRSDFPYRTKALIWALVGGVSLSFGVMVRGPYLFSAAIAHVVLLVVEGIAEGITRSIRAWGFRKHQRWFGFIQTALGAKTIACYLVPKRRALAVWTDVESKFKDSLIEQLRLLKSDPPIKEHTEARIETLTERIIEEQKLHLNGAFKYYTQDRWVNRFIFHLFPFHLVSKVVVKVEGETVSISIGLELLSVEKAIGRRIHLRDDVPKLLVEFKSEIDQVSRRAEDELSRLLTCRPNQF